MPFTLHILVFHTVGKLDKQVFKLKFIETKNDIYIEFPQTLKVLVWVSVFPCFWVFLCLSGLTQPALLLSIPLSLSLCLWEETTLRLWSITSSLINFPFVSNSGVHLNLFLCSVKNLSLGAGLEPSLEEVHPILHQKCRINMLNTKLFNKRLRKYTQLWIQ